MSTNTDLIYSLIKCGRVMSSATPDTMQTKYARRYKVLTKEFFEREMKVNGKLVAGRITLYMKYNDRGRVAEKLLAMLERGEYK